MSFVKARWLAQLQPFTTTGRHIVQMPSAEATPVCTSSKLITEGWHPSKAPGRGLPGVIQRAYFGPILLFKLDKEVEGTRMQGNEESILQEYLVIKPRCVATVLCAPDRLRSLFADTLPSHSLNSTIFSHQGTEEGIGTRSDLRTLTAADAKSPRYA
jgi:hypothetical protein